MENRKASVYIDNEPFNVKTYQRGTTNDLVARFGSAEKGQTNLDLLKAETQNSFRGGMFQRLFKDDEMASSITGAYFNDLDGNLYFTPDWQKTTLSPQANPSNITAWCVYGTKYLFLAYRVDYGSSIGNRIVRIDITTNTSTVLTLPAAVANAGCPITSMVTHKDAVFLLGSTWQNNSASTYFNIHRINTPDGTPSFTDISGVAYRLITFREKLYLINHLNTLYNVANEFAATGSFDVLKQGIGGGGAVPQQGHVEFNGALWFGKEDGLYRFDGVSVVPVIDYRKNPNTKNFRNLCMMQGRLYYTMGNKLYRFDGTNIEMVQDFTKAYEIVNITASVDRLWITTKNSVTFPSSDKYGGVSGQCSVFAYNGVGFFEYQNASLPEFDKQLSPIAMQVGDRLCFFFPDLFVNVSLEVRTNNLNYYYLDVVNEFTNTGIGSNRSFTIYSSEFDNGYPAVSKTLNGIMLEYEGLEANKSHLKIEAQYFTNGVWNGTWLELWNEKHASAVTNDYRLHEESEFATPNLVQAPSVYNKVKFRITCSIDNSVTLSDVPRLRSFSTRYTLQPTIKKRWQLGISLYGKDNRNIDTIYINGAPETRHSNQLRKIIYDALVNKKPVLFYDADYTQVKSTSPLKLKGTHQFTDQDVLAFDDTSSTKWINRRISSVSYNTGTDDTSLTLDSVGFRRVINASATGSLSNGMEVRRSHAVYITKISNERYILDENSVNDLNGYTDIPSDVVIELQEI